MMRKWLTILALGCPGLVAEDIYLVRVSDAWRWYKGFTEPSVPTTAWREASFNDRQWGTGVSGFALDPYAYEATVIADWPQNYGALYFRRQFMVEHPEQIVWLFLRVDYSGGFVAYLNGAEVARRGLAGTPGSPVPHNALADFHPRGTPEILDVSAEARLLLPGTNTLAIQWHRSAAMDWGAAFIPELLGNFTRGPYLQSTSTNQTQIVWNTPYSGDTVVEYGETPALGLRSADPNPTTNHVATLTGLKADTVYYYRVGSEAGGRLARSASATFRTLKSAGSVTFMAMGDIGLGTVAQFNVAEVLRRAQPDLVLIAGDVVYPTFVAGRLDSHFFSVYAPHLRTAPYFVVAGNHDTQIGDAQLFYDVFHMPTNSVDPVVHAQAQTAPESYYSFDQGDAHFVGLYLPLMQGPFALTNGSPQALWLEADLAASAKPWKFIFIHHMLASSGPHGEDDYNYNGIADPQDLAGLLLPLAKRYGVQLIIGAHDHDYERFNPLAGVHTLVTAGGGGLLYPYSFFNPASAVFWSRYHCIKVVIDGDALRMEALSDSGLVFDSMFLQRAPPPRRLYSATWNTPRIETDPADDGDGNINGQRFDFTGNPIPTMPGEFSNLGRVYVNYDHTNLYVGFEQVMVYADNNVFLFLQSPGRPGVSRLAGLGDGLVDAGGQGVDGLDFLENLSFTNFTPCVACLLGDEYGDRQYRGFARTNYVLTYQDGWPVWTIQSNLPVSIGQGVFRLDGGFSDVPGTRVQQFNRAGQLTPVSWEQNANFIEVAVPMNELGLRPGDRLRLAAVVGGKDFDTRPDRQARLLDRSYLGASFVSDGLGPAVLEGVEVQLGPDLDPDGDGLTLADELRLGLDPNNPDTDGDGLPDGWEVSWSLNARSAAGADGAAGDPDGDGFSNLQEYLAGTNPRDATSGLRIGVTLLGKTRVRLWWQAVPGRRYQLQRAESLGQRFSDVTGPSFPRTALSTSESYEEDLTAGGRVEACFYRVQVLP